MNTEPEFQTEDRDRRQEEVASVAKQLAEYGFYVMDALLPDNLRKQPHHPQAQGKRTTPTV